MAPTNTHELILYTWSWPFNFGLTTMNSPLSSAATKRRRNAHTMVHHAGDPRSHAQGHYPESDSVYTMRRLWRRRGWTTYWQWQSRHSRSRNGATRGGVQSAARNCPRSAGPAFQLRSRTTTPGADDPPRPHSEDRDPTTTRLTGGGWFTPAELSIGGEIHGDMGHGEQEYEGRGCERRTRLLSP
jgi:hypothetical protein